MSSPAADFPAEAPGPTRAPAGWRWAPAWVLAFVALWPAPGYAEGVMGPEMMSEFRRQAEGSGGD